MTPTPPSPPSPALSIFAASDLLEVRITTRNEADAATLAGLLVRRRLVAGVNLLAGMHSQYRWRDQLCSHTECLLLAQTTVERFPALEQAVCAVHSYEVPMIAAVPLTMVSPDFARWIREQTAPDSAPQPTT